MSNLSSTDYIAIYAAILSSVAILWNLYRDITNRGRLRVNCYLGELVVPGMPKVEGDLLVYNVTNVGRKPVVVTHVGGARGDKHFMITPNVTAWPKALGPGEYVLEYTKDLSVLDDKLRFLAAWDSLGRVYRVKRRVVRHLKKQASSR